MPITITQESQVMDTAKIVNIDINVVARQITFIVAKGSMVGEKFIAKRSQRVKIKDTEFDELAAKLPVDTNGVEINGIEANPVAKSFYDNVATIAYAFLIEKGYITAG